MEAAFRCVEEESVIGSQKKEHRQKAKAEVLSENVYRADE
jgi:hypothetical protein